MRRSTVQSLPPQSGFSGVWYVNLTIKGVGGCMVFAGSRSAKANGRDPKSCLGRVFNFKLDSFVMCALERNQP